MAIILRSVAMNKVTSTVSGLSQAFINYKVHSFLCSSEYKILRLIFKILITSLQATYFVLQSLCATCCSPDLLYTCPVPSLQGVYQNPVHFWADTHRMFSDILDVISSILESPQHLICAKSHFLLPLSHPPCLPARNSFLTNAFLFTSVSHAIVPILCKINVSKPLLHRNRTSTFQTRIFISLEI